MNNSLFTQTFTRLKPTKYLTNLAHLKHLKSLSALILATLLVACGGGGGGGSSAVGPSVSAFSHSAYTFAPNIAGDAAIGTNPQPVGQVQLNNNRIRGLIAARIGVTDPQEISALSAGTDYNISYSIDALAGSPAATFFSIDAATGAIEVSNPIGAGSGLTFDEIREFVGNSIKVKTTITFAIPQPGSAAAIKSTIESSVNVAILNAASSVDITSITTASLAYNRASVSAAGTANFNVAGAINENNNLQAPVSFGLPNNPAGLSRNPVAAFAIRSIVADSASAQVTLFYDVRDPTNVNQGCGASSIPNSIEGALYIDNSDLTLKASTSFNREAATNPQNNLYQCRLAVSTDGETYYPLAFVVNGAGSASAGGNQIDGANSNIVANLARVIQSNNLTADSSCSNTSNNRCYYGDLTVTITDVNEAPKVELVGGGSDFSGSTEGVGVLSTYISVAGTPYEESLATDGAKVDDIKLRINDKDSGQTTVGEISVVVAPDHRGIGAAFSVSRPGGNNPDGYELVVNTTLLDYEAFSPAQLTADDKAIYQITITARDNRTASLASTETFNFEVVDVKYPPVFVDPAINPRTYSADKPLESDAAFVKETNIINGTAGTPLYLLSGVRAFERHRIGRLAAVDPETGSGNDLTYTIVDPRSTVIHSNLQLIANGNNRGRRLIVAGGGLTETTAATTVTLQVAAPSGATRTLGVDLVVDNSRYADEGLILNPADTPDITFNSGISLVGSAAEESPASDNVIISFRNTVDLITPAFNALSGVSTDNKGSLTPTFALLPASAFNRISSALGSFSSDINQPSSSSNLGVGIENFVINTDGRISVRPGTGAFTFPAVFTLPVLVTPTPATGAPRFIAGMSDITIVTIATTDVNTPPQATAGRTQLNLTNKLTAQVNENLPAGTELARFTITDDNQAFANGQPTAMFSGATASDANTLLLLDLTKNTDGSSTASISSRIEFDYEELSHRNTLQNIVIRITDAGSYTLLNSTTMQLLPAPISTGSANTDAESLEVGVEITLQDAIENPVLAAGNGTSYSISESAGQGDSVAASDSQVVAIFNNAFDFPMDSGTGYNASRINFSVSGRFADILEVTPADNPDGNGMLALDLTVADPVRLENLGDGLTFPVTIVARDRVSRRVGSVSIDVTITNDPANSDIKQAVIDTALANLGRIRINEQDVVGRRSYPIPAANFSISLTDLAADADEFFQFNGRPTTRRLVVPELALEAVASARSPMLNPAEFVTTANILNLELGRDNIYRLSIGDTDFIERTLFGDITFDLVATSPADSYTALPRGTIAVTPATPKRVVYAAAATTTPATPPVYALAYTQTPYAEPVANISEFSPITIDATTVFNFGTIRGVAADSVNVIGEGAVYNTVALVDANGRNIRGNTRERFVARDFANLELLGIRNAATTRVDATTNSVIINFATATNDLLDFPSGFDILKPDATGNLIDASSEFNAYFDLAVNNTASPKHISISQKVFSQADNATRKYNALDTIQLYRGATEAYTLNYFIRARSATDGTGASNYALAQFSVAVRAPGSQEPPSISFTESVVANLNLNTNTEDTATFPIQLVLNSRDFLDSAITLAAGAITYDKVDFTIDQPNSPNLECSVSGNGLPLFSSGATSTPDRTGDGSTTIVGTLADDLAALTFGDIKSSSGNCANPEIGSSITAITFTGVNATIVSSSSSTSDRTASFDVPINALLPTAADYTIQGYRIEPHQIALTVDGVGESGGQLQINTLPDSQTSITVTITDGDPDDGTPLDPTPNGNANIIRTGGPAAAWTSLQSSDVTLTSCPGISIDSVGSYTTVSGNAAAASVAIVLETSADADSVANNACTLSITTGEDGQLLNAGATIRVINPPRVFVDRLDTANTRVTTLANAVNDFNLDFASLDSGQKNALLNELATQGGLPNDFSNNVPFRVYSEGLFFIGVSVTAADPAVEAGTVTFMQSITADACVVTLVNAVRELDTNLDAGYASALYQITRTDAGGVCPAITIPVTQQGVTAMGSVILPAGSLIFDGVPAISEPQEVTGFIAYNTNITYESTVTDTDTSTDGSSPVVTASSGDANICRVTNPSITQQSDNSATATIQITPIAPGTCSITVSVTEDGRAGTDRSFLLTLPHTAPTVVANSDNSGLTALQGSSISIKVEATKRDPGTSVAEFPRSITSAAPVCTASIGDGLGNIAVDYTNDQIGAIASVNYTVTSAFAIDCGAFTFTATENSEIGTAATLPDIRFISPTSATPTLTLNTGDGASMLNFSADALGSINLSISRNSHLLSDAIANPTLVVTASVPSSATCTVNPTTTTLSYSGNPQTATADFSIDWTGEEGRGGTCPVTIKVQEQDRELVTLATTIIFTAVGRVDLAINPSTFPNDTFPNAFFARERVNVTATATKRDTLTDPDTGVIFRKPVLVFEQIENYCVVISPTSDTPRNFTPNVIGDNETLDYVFGVNPDLGGRFNGRCEWRITTSSQGISGNNNSVIINPSFAISDYPPLLNVSEIATNVYPDDGAVPLNLTVTKRDNLPLITSGISTAITTSVGPCSVTRVQEVVYPSIDWGSIGTASYNVMFVGDATNGGTCVLNKFTATEDDHLTTTVTEERSITFLAEAPPAAAFNIEGSSSAPASSFTTLNITLTKQDASTNKELTIPSVVGSSACTATLIGDAPARFTGGIGSSIELSYNITSTHIRPVDGCGNFPFPFTEGSAAGTTDFDGDSISFTPPLGNVAPTIQVSVIGEGQVMDSEPVTINVTATKQDFEGERVTFPQTVMSSAPVCTANLATGFTAEVNYGGSDADLTASVQYTVMPNTPINCGDFNFNATEDALVVRAVPLAGILFFNQASTAPLVEFQGGSDFNVTAGVRSTRVNLIITRRSHLSSTPLENPTVSIFVDTSSPSCSRLGSSFGREYGVTPSSTISTGAINYELDVSLINDVDMRDGGTCLVNVLVREPGQLEVASMLRIRFLPVAAQVDFNTDYTGNEGNPFFAVANKNIIVTATATKGDAIAEDGRRGVIFHSILVNSTPAGACVLTTSPAVSITTTGGNSSIIDFPATARGSQRVLAYEFGVATGFRAQRVECEWALSATAEHSPDTSATPTSVYLQFTIPGNDPPTFTITEGNVTRFPDEGPVQYTLNITRQDEIGDGQLVVTPTTADACRIISPAQPPAYQNRMATATYGVVYTGAANGEGDLPGGTCVVNFVVAEDGATAPVQQSSVTFNTELAPSITVQVIGNRVDLPADQTVNVSVTATKRDSSPTPDVTFPREVISSSRCSATLVGNEIKQYNDILGGSSSATVTYIIATGPDGGDCSNFAFTATEGTATATNNFASDISFVEPDADGDGVSDAVDVDKDGDGLIELSTATQLDAIRYNLAGTGLRLVSRLRPNNANGCPATGGCRGYELVADIDLSAYANWNNLGLSSTRFTATFEGNNHTISNLNFDEGNFVTIGQGLFAYIHNAVISNVHLRNVSISSIGSNVGGLVGSASGTSTIINSSVTGPLLRSTNFQTGGLVGVATSGVQIISSYVEIEEISSAENTGGLLGRGNAVVIRDSYAIIDKIKSVSRTRANHVGGLVGYADGVNISFSLAIVNEMMTSSTNRDNSYAGGLVGYGLSSNIASSAAITGSFIPPTQYHQFYAAAGGLTAWGYRASIESSYAVTKNIFTVNAPPDTGPGPLGPLVGTLRNIITPPTVSASYWDKTTRTPPSTVNFDATNHGQGKSTTDLQGTTDFSGIYSAWGNSWCDATTNEFATDPSHPLATIPNADANRFWDLGTATEYPAMNCLPNFTPAEQRATMAKALNGESPLRN